MLLVPFLKLKCLNPGCGNIGFSPICLPMKSGDHPNLAYACDNCDVRIYYNEYEVFTQHIELANGIAILIDNTLQVVDDDDTYIEDMPKTIENIKFLTKKYTTLRYFE